jgi:ankyrin repeat protein
MPLVRTLIDAGAVIDAHYPTDHCCIDDGMMGAEAIHYAAACKDPAFIALLLEKGAKADAETIGGLRPIHIAAASGSEAIVSLLLAAGADANAKDPDGKTAFELAAKKGRKQITKLLPKPDAAQ